MTFNMFLVDIEITKQEYIMLLHSSITHTIITLKRNPCVDKFIHKKSPIIVERKHRCLIHFRCLCHNDLL